MCDSLQTSFLPERVDSFRRLLGSAVVLSVEELAGALEDGALVTTGVVTLRGLKA